MSTPFERFEGFKALVRRVKSTIGAKASSDRKSYPTESVIIFTDECTTQPISPRSFALLVMAFMLYKGLATAYLGPQAYDAAIHALQSGSIFEQIAAFFMKSDFLSRLIAVKLGPVFWS